MAVSVDNKMSQWKKVHISKNVEKKIEISRQITERFCCGYLVGRFCETETLIFDIIELDLTLFENFDLSSGPTDEIQAEFAAIRASFPVGINIIGVFITQPENGNIEVAEYLIKYLKQIEDIITCPDLEYIVCLIKPSCCLWHITQPDKTLHPTQEATLKDINVSKELLFRIRKTISLNYLVKNSGETCLEELDVVSSINSKSAFLINEIGTVLFDNDEGQVLANITGNDIINELKKVREIKHWPENKALGNVVDVTNLIRMSFEINNGDFDTTLDTTNESVDTNLACSVPVLLSKRVNGECATVKLSIDALVLAPAETPAPKLLFMFRDAVYRQSMALNYMMKNQAMIYQPYHFLTSTESIYPTTVLLPQADQKGVAIMDDANQNYRRKQHKRFFIQDDHPVFKLCLSAFHERRLSNYHLVNPHEGLNLPDVEGAKVAIVKGKYSYHHYMQDNFDDNIWGCAYRSLQTLASWFWFQGYTEKKYPSHEEIQRALVEIGDKEEGFIGSKEWIGSMEVSYCLDHLYSVTSKTLHVSTGADMAYKGRELYNHFLTQGTPVMIGGGVLAHTIVGVVYNEETGYTKFLIVDPHFTGNDVVKTVQSKSWVGWKGPDFWNQTAHYNMCMPQRPKEI